MSEDKLTSWLKNKLDKAFSPKNPKPLNETKPEIKSDTRPNFEAKNNLNKSKNSQFMTKTNSAPHTTKGAHFSKTPFQKGPIQKTTFKGLAADKAIGGGASLKGTVRIAALGGLDEVGKNMMFFEYYAEGASSKESDIVIVDMGFQFPDEEMLGIDYVIPDISYLESKKDKIRGILLTHGHLDHIGAIPYLLDRLGNPPIYGTKLTQGFVKKRLEEFGLLKSAKVHTFHPDDTLRLGQFTANFFRVNHSIPDAVGIFLQSPAGNFVHTGDFKFDFTPAGDQKVAEFAKLATFANRGVTALFSDSTNALRPGQTISEKVVGKNLEEIIKKAEGRIIITAFASLIGRLQQILDYAQRYKRQVFLSGRSLLDNLEIARNLGYLKYPNHLIHDINKLRSFPDSRVMILTTGSQGEDVSALTRISLADHPHIKLKKGDTVIISATPIIGNEKAVVNVINNLCRLGAHVVHSKRMEVHTSGHACQEDLKLMISLVKPKYLIPVHGEYHMRVAHKELGMELGMQEENCIVVENGDVMEVKNGTMRATSEKVPANFIMVDGLGIGDIGTQVIEDRKIMSQNGVLVVLLTTKNKKLVRDPDVISRGFIYMQESEKIMSELAKAAKDAYKKILDKSPDVERGNLKRMLRNILDKKCEQLIERRPLIIPIIAEEVRPADKAEGQPRTERVGIGLSSNSRLKTEEVS